MPTYYLAQLNIARLLAPIDHPQIADFVAQIPTINALAEQSEGFVWRLKDEESDNATSYNPFGDPLYIVNMSVWTSIEALREFAFKSAHRHVMKDRNNWFEKHVKPYLVLWWVLADHEPTIDEAKERLNHLQQHGESPFAFTFKVKYDAQGNLV